MFRLFRQPRLAKRSVGLRCEALETRDVPYAPVANLVVSNFPVVQTSSTTDSATLSGTKLKRANQVISTFENSTKTLQYGYIENINDGRGFTAGRAGFTTGTGDLVLVVERYAQVRPTATLAKYLPRLRELADTGSDSTEGLPNFVAIWKKTAAVMPAFRAVQDYISNQLYLYPAIEKAQALGLKNTLTLVALYETGIQHGHGDDPDGLPAIITRTNDALGGTPGTGVNEQVWLARFLNEREDVLNNPSDPDTRDAWQASVERVQVLRGFMLAGNVSFNGPLRYTVFGDEFVVS